MSSIRLGRQSALNDALPASAASVGAQIVRSGWSGQTRFSISPYENNSPEPLSDPRIFPSTGNPHRVNHAAGGKAIMGF
jgi:hypothetical protein